MTPGKLVAGLIWAAVLSGLTNAGPIPGIPNTATDVKPVDNRTYPPFQEAEEKQQQIELQMLAEAKADANAHLTKTLKDLQHADPPHRAEALARLGYSDSAEAYDALVSALRDKDSEVVIAAADGLRLHGDRKAVRVLLARHGRHIGLAEISIATALFALGETTASGKTLVSCLADSVLWKPATYHLSDELGATPEAFAILSRGVRRQTPAVQYRALEYFMNRAGQKYRTFPILVSALQDSQATFRFAALSGLMHRKQIYGPLSCADALPVLKKLQDDANVDWDSRTRARACAEDIEEALAGSSGGTEPESAPRGVNRR